MYNSGVNFIKGDNMLQLKKITKEYPIGETQKFNALKEVSINFRKSEFVAILGPSGCGKTTTLNIIGGLDHYTTGDLIINGKSTKDFKDKDWDNYRNKSIGFVFQSYNLIPHLNLINNVAMGLTLAGMKKTEKIELAKVALEKVGLGGMEKKRPNQLSGGQMQRVAIARAIVGNPDIILADEPTGALDSETGIQIMDLLKEIAKEKLVIMVTHNSDLAQEYATRIIKFFDGNLIEDSNPYLEEELKKDFKNQQENKPQEKIENSNGKKKEKVGISIPTAFDLSSRTLKQKKGRTITTSIAGSIGIFAIALILSISTGLSGYINNLSSSALGTSAITISETTTSMSLGGGNGSSENDGDSKQKYPSDATGIYPYTQNQSSTQIVYNNLSEEFIEYLNNMDKTLTSTVEYSYSTKMNVIAQTQSGYKLISTASNQSSMVGGGMFGTTATTSWYDISSQTLSNSTLITDSYDVLYKTTETGLPTNANELVLVVDKYNQVDSSILEILGYDTTKTEISYEDICSKEFKLILNNDFYKYDESSDRYIQSQTDETLFNSQNAITLKIVGVLRVKNDDATAWLNSGIVYSSALTDLVRDDAKNSVVGQAQIASTTKNVLTGQSFAETATSTIEKQYENALKAIGVYSSPTSISIYPANIDAKDQIVSYIDAWNEEHPDNKITYTDISEMLMSTLSSLINIISYVLIAFCAVSLIVSTVMISVTTYTSVIERTKEIGVLRSLGARKKDISRIFNAETITIGAMSGVIGVVFVWIIGAVVNLILKALLGVSIVSLGFGTAIIMILLSTCLTWIAGLIPAKIASKKDPVLCLRTE